jgi:hypothetical protein
MRRPASSVEYVSAPVTSDVDLSALPVEMAVSAGPLNPVEEDWQAAEWDGSDARLLVGPLEAGTMYSVWVRVTSSPEVPVIYSGPLHAF